MTASTSPSARTPSAGAGRVLVVVYAILALAATGRSFYQIVSEFDEAPVAYALSALAAVVYILATVALVAPGERWRRIALVTIGFELVGVLVVGTMSLVVPELFAHASVWSWFGAGYLFIPLVLPVLGLLYLTRRGRATSTTTSTAPTTTAPTSTRGRGRA